MDRQELAQLNHRTRMITGTKVPGESIDEQLVAYNTESARFHGEVRRWEAALDAGQGVPKDVENRLRQSATHLEHRRSSLATR